MSPLTSPSPVSRELIRLDARAQDKTDAIAQVAQMLVAAGCVAPGYEASMGRREALANTFLGHGVAIPHGLGEDRDLVRRDGIAVLQLPEGVEWNPGQVTRLVVGIAAQSDTHITLLRRLTRLIQDEATLQRLFTTHDASDIVNALASDVAVTVTHVPVADLAERFDWTIAYPSGLHARPATRWAESARGFTAPCAGARGRSGGRCQDVWWRCCSSGFARRCRECSAEGADAPALLAALRKVMNGLVRRGRRCPALLAALRKVMNGLVAQEKTDAERAALAEGGAGRGHGIRPKRRRRSSASAPAPGWPSARCMYWPARRPMLPIARPRSARAAHACRMHWVAPASSWPRCRTTPSAALAPRMQQSSRRRLRCLTTPT